MRVLNRNGKVDPFMIRDVGLCLVQKFPIFSRYLVFCTIQVPRYFGIISLLGFFFIVVLFSAFAGGYIYYAANYLALISGFNINQVIIKGNKHVSEIDVLGALELDGRTSIISFNAEKARQAIASYSWVADVSIQKLYPDRLEIMIIERTPIALWQRQGRVNVIDKQGHIITPYRADINPYSLPLFIGNGAEYHAASFLEQIRAFPSIYTQALAYVRVTDRRWDILLRNGIRIQLPEKNAFKHLSVALNLGGEKILLSRDVVKIDLRIAGRIIVSLPQDAVLGQKTMFFSKKRDKQKKAKWI